MECTTPLQFNRRCYSMCCFDKTLVNDDNLTLQNDKYNNRVSRLTVLVLPIFDHKN